MQVLFGWNDLNNSSLTEYTYIHTSYYPRLLVPYGKLWTEFFPSFYGPSAKRAGHENKEGRKRGSITCRTEQADEDNKDVYCMAFYYSGKRTKQFDVLTLDQELEVRTATYGPETDQSQHAKTVSHIIKKGIELCRKRVLLKILIMCFAH